MTIDRAIEIFDPDCPIPVKPGELEPAMYMAANALRFLKIMQGVPTVSDWVSVKDRLPEEDADVLVWNELGIEIAAYTTNPVKRWYSYTGQEVFVKYWMILPKPPKEDTDNA